MIVGTGIVGADGRSIVQPFRVASVVATAGVCLPIGAQTKDQGAL